MAKVNVEEIVDHLDSDIRRALEDTVKTVVRDGRFDAHELCREFKRNVRRRFSTWETVPDRCVKMD